MRILLLLLWVGTVNAAETAIHNVTAYTSTNTGVTAFNVLVISEDGKIAATGGPELLAHYPEAQRIDAVVSDRLVWCRLTTFRSWKPGLPANVCIAGINGDNS